jgi:acetylornithine deacetylase/succinyl-diaminopimelate desuccinylase-like protein
MPNVASIPGDGRAWRAKFKWRAPTRSTLGPPSASSAVLRSVSQEAVGKAPDHGIPPSAVDTGVTEAEAPGLRNVGEAVRAGSDGDPLGIPAFAYGGGRLDVSHGPSEYIDEAAMRRCAAVYALFAAEITP